MAKVQRCIIQLRPEDIECLDRRVALLLLKGKRTNRSEIIRMLIQDYVSDVPGVPGVSSVPVEPETIVAELDDWSQKTAEERQRRLDELEGKTFDSFDAAVDAYEDAVSGEPLQVIDLSRDASPSEDEDIAAMAARDISQRCGWDVDKAIKLIGKLGVDGAWSWVKQRIPQ